MAIDNSPGSWIRHISTWKRTENDRRPVKGRPTKTVTDMVRAEVIRTYYHAKHGLMIVCEDIDGIELPTKETRPDFPAHLRWHYPIYEFIGNDCESIGIDLDAKKLKEERKKAPDDL